MATLLRTGTSRIVSQWGCLRRHSVAQRICSIHTSKENKDVLTPTVDSKVELGKESRLEELRRLKEHFANQDPNAPENYVSYGYDYTDYEYDWFSHRMTMFFYLSVAFVGICFVLPYLPDPKLRHWSFREAYLEIERREKLGLPLIDPNYVDPSKIVLPTEEEIKKEEIEIII